MDPQSHDRLRPQSLLHAKTRDASAERGFGIGGEAGERPPMFPGILPSGEAPQQTTILNCGFTERSTAGRKAHPSKPRPRATGAYPEP